MKYRRLGNTGLKVSEISLGSWLTYGATVDTNIARNTMLKAYDMGVNFFDTANVYARGEAEKVVGNILKEIPRSSYVLASKVFWPMGEGPNDKGLSRKHVMEQCDASLQRLGLDYLDIYYCHRFDPETPVEETLRALDDLVTQGKVRYVGVSEWSAAQIVEGVHVAKAFNFDPIVVNQPLYNMLSPKIEEEILPYSSKYGIGTVAFSPLAQGVLTGKYLGVSDIPAGSRAADETGSRFIERFLTQDVLDRVKQLKALAEEQGMSLAQFSLAWVLRRQEVSSALIGATKPEQVEENLKAIEFEIEAEVWQQVDEILNS